MSSVDSAALDVQIGVERLDSADQSKVVEAT